MWQIIIADVAKNLAKLIEINIFNENKLNKIIKHTIKQHKLNTLDMFTLGCTHFELVKHIFEKHCKSKIFNNSSNIIDKVHVPKTNELNVVIKMSREDEKLKNKILKLLNLN